MHKHCDTVADPGLLTELEGHAVQVPLEACPTAALYVPAAHGVHSLALELEYVPTGHGSHSVAPESAVNVPAAHASHAAAPSALMNVPGAHGVHSSTMDESANV